MFFIPIAIFVGDGDITVGYYIWKSMIPTVIGNIVGGGFFVAAAYWYLVSIIPQTDEMIEFLC
jgi:formate/nitrite transporter FocA (FNT family)